MITLIVLVVLFFGIRFNFTLSAVRRSLVLNIVILGNIYLLKVHIDIINDKVYYYINNGRYRRLYLKLPKERLDIRFPKLNLHDGSIVIDVASDDAVYLSVFGGLSNMLFSYLQHSSFLHFDSFKGSFQERYDDFSLDVFVEFTIKFDFIKIIFMILRTLVLSKIRRRHYATKSNRRVDGVNA